MPANRVLTAVVFTDVKSGTIDFGGSAGTDRYIEIVPFWDAANLGAQQYSGATIGGLAVPFTHYSTSTVDIHAERYALGSSSALDALSGVQPWALTGTPDGVNWHVIITVWEDAGAVAFYQTSDDAFTAPLDLSANVADGDLVNFLVLNAASDVWTFDAPLVEYRNVNPGGPPVRIAAAEAAISASATGATFGGQFAANSIQKLAFMTVISPVAIAEASYKSDVPPEGALITLAGSIIASPPAGFVPGAQVWITDDANGARTLAADGTFSTTLPGTDTIPYRVYNSAIPEWMFYTHDLIGSGTIGSLTFPAGDIRHLSQNIAFSTDVNISNLAELSIRFSDGAGDGAGDVEIEVVPTGANAGVFDFALFPPVTDGDTITLGIEADSGATATLYAGDVAIAAGTYTSRAPLAGYARKPLSLDAAALPGLTVGLQFLIEDLLGGTITPQGLYTPPSAAALTLTYYTHATGVWTQRTQEYNGAQVIGGTAAFTAAAGRSYVLLQDPLSSDALPGLLAGAGFEYENLSGSLTIYSDGSRAYAGSINTSYQGRHWVAGSWQTDSAFAVFADLALADPNYSDPAAVLQGGALQLPLASVYGPGFADPQVVIANSDANMAAFGFPAGSTISGGVITIDTSSAFDGDVLVRAELRGVVVEDVIRLQVLQGTVGLSPASIEHLHAVSSAVIDEVPRVQPGSLVHSQSMAEPALVTLTQVSPAAVTHAQPVSLPSITQSSALSVIAMQHDQSLSTPLVDFDALLDPASVEHSQAVAAVIQLGHRLQPASVQQAMQAAELVIGNVPRVAPISVEHRAITSATGLDLRLVIVNLEQAQRVAGSDVRQTFLPLALANLEHLQSVAEVLDLLQANVLQPVTLEHLHIITNQTAVALSNTPLIPAGTLIIIR